MQLLEKVRIDKWLWAVRLFKSRSLAAKACNAGHVKISGQSVKASREIRGGEIIEAVTGFLHRSVKVQGILDQRVSAKKAADFLEDQTPSEEYARARELAASAKCIAPKGLSRPTKKQRRDLSRFLDSPGL